MLLPRQKRESELTAALVTRASDIEWLKSEKELECAKLTSERKEAVENITAERDKEVRRLKEELEASERKWRAKEAAWEKERAEAVKEAAEQSKKALRMFENTLAGERETRIAQVGKQIIRRVKNRDLGRGFEAWSGYVVSRRDAMEKMNRVANKLRAPDLSNAFSEWAEDWEETARALTVAKREGNIEALFEAAGE